MPAVLVTGASGFIGRQLCLALHARGHLVRALGRNRPDGIDCEFVPGDISDGKSLGSAFRGVDTVFHSAALLGPPSQPLAEFRRVNVDGTRNVAVAARAAGVRRFVHISTVAVTGGVPDAQPAGEDFPPRPRSRYAITKWEAEAAVRDALGPSVSLVTARPGWVYGAGSASTIKLMQLIARRRMVLVGAASNFVQPIAVDDLVEGLLACQSIEAASGRTYNFVGPRPFTTQALCDAIAAAAGAPAPRIRIPLLVARAAAAFFEALPSKPGRKLPIDSAKIDFFRVHQVHSTRRAEAELGWLPKTQFLDGAAAVVQELRASGLLA
ncbi:MAG: NAD-dependent epimerase/dehydratase family protein [Acidobacteria bacterium]|nr:NAD-dependent epimerase/dehydratase family protein [Acidobacteriota bacterium]